MTDFKPGDIVNIEIRGAEVLGTYTSTGDSSGNSTCGQEVLTVRHGTLSYNLIIDDITITKRPPQPQPGDME